MYYKFSQVFEKVKINIDINSDFKKFNNINSKLNKNILKIMGILIDNAIESAIESDKKFLNMELEIKNKTLLIKIKNSTKNEIDNKKIMNSGYSTKGKGRGYGLSLVNDILKKQKEIKININYNSGIFEVVLKIVLQ